METGHPRIGFPAELRLPGDAGGGGVRGLHARVNFLKFSIDETAILADTRIRKEIAMTNTLNIHPKIFRRIESLTAAELATVRRNGPDREYTDEQVREMLMQYVADGGDIADFRQPPIDPNSKGESFEMAARVEGMTAAQARRDLGIHQGRAPLTDGECAALDIERDDNA
jgi:hypothetical protein